MIPYSLFEDISTLSSFSDRLGVYTWYYYFSFLLVSTLFVTFCMLNSSLAIYGFLGVSASVMTDPLKDFYFKLEYTLEESD